MEEVHQLLKPRYKCVADFWKNPFKIGDIIQMSFKRTSFWPFFNEDGSEDLNEYWHAKVENEKGTSFYNELAFSRYPNLFKPLKWCEDRKPEELQTVTYIKEVVGFSLSMDSVHRVNQWRFDFEPMIEIDAGRFNPWHFVPVAETDYLIYLNSQK